MCKEVVAKRKEKFMHLGLLPYVMLGNLEDTGGQS
jgi:hypothetical protein